MEIEKWTGHSWIGFYQALKQHLENSDWDYVSNPKGGFLGFWWHWHGGKEKDTYLQLEQQNLCFKIMVRNNSERKSEREASYRAIIEASGEIRSNLVIGKPDRFGNGRYMTVCVSKEDYRVSRSDGTLDFEATIQNIKSAEKILTKSLSSQLVV